MKTIVKLLIILSFSLGSNLYSQDKAEVDFILQRISAKYDKNSLFKVTEPPKSYYTTSSNKQYEIANINTDGLLGGKKKTTDPNVVALVELKVPNQFTPTKNINVNSRLGKYITIEFNISNLSELVNNSDVKSISLGGYGFGLRPELDESAKAIGLDSVRQNYFYKGKNVVVGIIDHGIDIKHKDFKRDDGTSRILYFWDQADQQGPVPNSFTYGTVWHNADLTNPPNNFTHKDSKGHGTHVAGIAAGMVLSYFSDYIYCWYLYNSK